MGDNYLPFVPEEAAVERGGLGGGGGGKGLVRVAQDHRGSELAAYNWNFVRKVQLHHAQHASHSS